MPRVSQTPVADQEIQTAERWDWRRNKVAGTGTGTERKASDCGTGTICQTQACIDLRQEWRRSKLSPLTRGRVRLEKWELEDKDAWP
jgi:hypothetical protein